MKDLIKKSTIKGEVKTKCSTTHSEKLNDMLIANTVMKHLEQMFYELKDDPAIWKDWETYFNTYLANPAFRKNWQQSQFQYQSNFRAYVNNRLD